VGRRHEKTSNWSAEHMLNRAKKRRNEKGEPSGEPKGCTVPESSENDKVGIQCGVKKKKTPRNVKPWY